MTKKYWMLLALALVLGGISLYLNTDWFARDDIHIMFRSMPPRPGFFRRRQADTAAVNPVLFGLDRKLKLTQIEVVVLADIKTNKYPHALWHLQSDSNSVPIKDFFYGDYIQGMHPAFRGTVPEALEPGVKYRLLVEAGSRKAQIDFEPAPRTP
jgi:hypothetical protein